ncbi:phenylalanine--tRNA ligase subunit beta [bacterium]|nr:phenylalanine--tRNA ligase subunit beta [bacterium]
MKVTTSWLHEYVDFSLPIDELCVRLTQAGLEVESCYNEAEAKHGDELVALSQQSGFPLDDMVLDLEITPNRPDCLSIVGIAREVSVICGKPFLQKKVNIANAGPDVATAATLQVMEPQACPRYIGIVISGIEVGESPTWLKRRLMAVDLRPINNVVDISNYLMIETGQPLHCFDLDNLQERKVIVRFAREGERIVTLDEEERKLSHGTLVIADAKRPVAIAGVMGGLLSGIGDSTTNLFLECAAFDAPLIRKTARAISLHTESSHRFERGVDLKRGELCSQMAAAMIVECCGGSILPGVLESCPERQEASRIWLRPEWVNEVLGTSIPEAKMHKILLSLGFSICRDEDSSTGRMWVEPPSFRLDVVGEEDLVEEIARVHGFDAIEPRMPRTQLSSGRLDIRSKLHRRIKGTLKSMGLCEVFTLSLFGDDLLDKCRIPTEDKLRSGVRLKNPLNEDEGILRTFLLPSVLSCASHNARHKALDSWLYGLGRVFIDEGSKTPDEQIRLSVVIHGEQAPPNWTTEAHAASFYHIKGILERIASDMGLDEPSLTPADVPYGVSGQCFDLIVDSKRLGLMGKLHPDVSAAFDLTSDCYFAELSLDIMMQMQAPQRGYTRFSLFPSVTLDLAITLKKGISHDQVASVIREIGKGLVKGITLFDRYEGKQIPADRVGLAFSIVYGAADRTLVAAEALERHQAIIDGLSEQLGAILRI